MGLWQRLFAAKKEAAGREPGRDFPTVHAVFEAMQAGDLAEAERLLSEDEKRASRVLRTWLTETAYGGLTLLNVATLGDHPDFARLFLAKGADPNLRCRWFRETPLHVAVSLGHTAIAELLLSSGADINAGDSHGQTPLHRAARDMDPAMTKRLLAKGGDPGAVDDLGNTPLHLAATHFRPELVRLYLSKGASTEKRNQLGRTPLEAAKENWEGMRQHFATIPPTDPDYPGALRLLEWGPQVLALLGSEPPALILRCEGCKAGYAIGDNAVIVTMDQTAALFDAAVRLHSDHPLQEVQQDLVASSVDIPAERRGLVLDQAKETARTVVESLQRGQRRAWICHRCKHANVYPQET